MQLSVFDEAEAYAVGDLILRHVPHVLRAVLYGLVAYVLLKIQPYQDEGHFALALVIGIATMAKHLRCASAVAIGLLLVMAIVPPEAFGFLAKRL
jgi:hypothetical protein